MEDIRERLEADREKMNQGMEESRWDSVMTMLRFGIKREIILDIVEKVRKIYTPYYCGCKNFEASEEFTKAIPHPRLTAEDYKNLQYSEEKLESLYHPDAYQWGENFIRLAYIVYLLAADVSGERIAIMFDIDEEYIQEVQRRLAEQVPDVYDYETFVMMFWEEKLYIAQYQCGIKFGRLQVKRELIIKLLKRNEGTLAEISSIMDVPIDILEQMMKSIGIEKREAISFGAYLSKKSDDAEAEKEGSK